MAKARPFERADIPQLVDLCPRAFPEVMPYPPAVYFEEFFFRSPCVDEEIRSLVIEGPDGRIVGFIGVMPRRFVLNDRTLRVAIATRLMVAPEARTTGAGLTLFNTFLSGPQDLSLGDTANAPGAVFWQAFRGQTIWPHGVNWRCTLRSEPTRRLRAALNGRRALRPAGALAEPLLAAVDGAATGIRRRRNPLTTPAGSCMEIEAATIVANITGMTGHRVLAPRYDEVTLDWLVKRAAAKTVNGELKMMGVRDAEGRLLGWFIYYLKHRGLSVLMQLAAKPHSGATVLDCLIAHAAQGGATAITGRLEPLLLQPLAARPDISFQLSPYWMVAHTRNPDLMAAIHRGDALLSRLDGEWSMAFHGEALDDASRPQYADAA